MFKLNAENVQPVGNHTDGDEGPKADTTQFTAGVRLSLTDKQNGMFLLASQLPIFIRHHEIDQFPPMAELAIAQYFRACLRHLSK